MRSLGGVYLDLDRFAKMKENLVNAGDGTFISKNDPYLWHKLLKKNPRDEKALYHVGLSLEQEALKYLSKYRETRLIYFFYLYKKRIRESLDLLNKSWKAGYLYAGREILRINGAAGHRQSKKASGPWLKRAALLGVLLLCFLLGILISFLFFTDKPIIFKEIAEERYTYMLPYQVIEDRPAYIPARDYEIKTVIIEGDLTREKIANSLVSAIKTMYERDPGTPKKVTASYNSSRGQMEVGMALWAGENSNIYVYLYPGDKPPALTTAPGAGGNHLLWETTTVIRSALYQFARQNGYMPQELSALTGPYPDNYLTALPKDPYCISNSVHPGNNGGGGWVYAPENTGLHQDSVSRALKPNLPDTENIPFSPLYIYIDKSKNTLTVYSGSTAIRNYRAALGRDGKTPEGSLYIARKAMLPCIGVNAKKQYGTRVMELSNREYAIHGTDDPGSVGKNVSLGCIRLYSHDMEDLYSIIPLYTPVIVSGGGPGQPYSPSEAISPDEFYIPANTLPRLTGELYVKNDSPKETAGMVSFKWRG